RFASIRTWEYRESIARETCPAMLMMVLGRFGQWWFRRPRPHTEQGRNPPRGGRNKTLSCSCLVQKRKNFVSRGGDHSAALRGPSRLGLQKVSWASFRSACAPAADHALRKPAPAAIVRGYTAAQKPAKSVPANGMSASSSITSPFSVYQHPSALCNSIVSR